MDHDTASCFAELTADILRIGNARIERRWQIRDGLLLPISLTIDGREWLAGAPQPGSVPPHAPTGSGQPRLELRHGRACPVEAPSLSAELHCGPDLAWGFQVFPDVAAVSCRLLRWPVGVGTATTAQTAAISGIEGDHGAAAHDDGSDLCERLVLASHHAHVHDVHLADRTDGHDNLATSFELRITPCEPLRLTGCIFAIEDPLGGDGLILLKQAPLPHARPLPNAVDLRAWFDGGVTPGRPAVALHGHGVRDGGLGYAWSVAGYSGGAAGRIAALHRLQRCFRTVEAGRDGRLLSNTWGDRNRDGRICADFMAREIEAGAALGVEVVQIDDGWQRGTTSNSVNREQGGVWQGFWAADDRFWDANPQRFPAGLAGTAALAREHGLAFGLWFAPDSIDDFRNWRRDADTVLGFWRTHGVTRVKIDGVKAHSKPGEINLQRFFTAVLGESAGAITFDLDVTAEVRPGYVGAMQAGPLFVENRYTDWHRWWPHATLRNLWQLAHWIDPVRLRMEFLNRHRNAAQYAGDPLAPMAYPADWLFASIMVASPLAWFEVSELPAEDAARLAPLIALWKQHRTALHGGTILPVGACPSGAACSGFCSLAADGRSAMLVALREPAAGGDARWTLPLAAGSWNAEVLAGSGTALMDGSDVTLGFAAAPSYLLVRLSRST